VDPEKGVTARPHSAELHTLKNENVAQLRASLLEWFADVRDVRGMPWRQPAMATSPEGQAQRAYEVRHNICSFSDIDILKRYGSLRSCYNRRRWLPLFPNLVEIDAAYRAIDQSLPEVLCKTTALRKLQSIDIGLLDLDKLPVDLHQSLRGVFLLPSLTSLTLDISEPERVM
jgi:hypothetical protein